MSLTEDHISGVTCKLHWICYFLLAACELIHVFVFKETSKNSRHNCTKFKPFMTGDLCTSVLKHLPSCKEYTHRVLLTSNVNFKAFFTIFCSLCSNKPVYALGIIFYFSVSLAPLVYLTLR